MHITFDCTLPRHELRYRGVERVVLLIGERSADGYTVRHAVAVPNRHKLKAGKFKATIEDARYLLGSMMDEVIGVIHSHPHGDREPSAQDLAQIEDGYIGGVYCNGSVTSWYTRNRPLHTARVSYRGAEWAASA